MDVNEQCSCHCRCQISGLLSDFGSHAPPPLRFRMKESEGRKKQGRTKEEGGKKKERGEGRRVLKTILKM